MNDIGRRNQDQASASGLRVIAIFEASKGVLVLLVGLGLLSLAHHGVQDVGEEIVERFHLNLAHRHPRILIDLVTHLNNSHVRLLAVAALLYATVRFIEAYGLWRMRTWAEWFAILSGGIYLPIEFYELIHHATVIKAVVLVVNIGIVAYLIYVRRSPSPGLERPGEDLVGATAFPVGRAGVGALDPISGPPITLKAALWLTSSTRERTTWCGAVE